MVARVSDELSPHPKAGVRLPPLSYVSQMAVAAAAAYEKTAVRLAKELDVSVAEAKEKLQRLSREVVLPSWAISPPDRRDMPANPRDRRTVRLGGKPYHYTQDGTGQLHTTPGESPWT